jgi:hypothetical protein
MGWKEESREAPVQAGAERTECSAEVLRTFTFDLRFDPIVYRERADRAVNRWILWTATDFGQNVGSIRPISGST